MPSQLSNIMDKEEKFDIVDKNISKIKDYILEKTTWKLKKVKNYH